MSNEKSAEESRREYIEIMGEELGVAYHELWQELAWLHSKWEEYEELFVKKTSRIDLLNRASPFFFGMVQKIFRDDIFLHIARLTDPPNIGKKKNLTIKMLASLVNEDLKTDLEEKTGEAVDAAKFCRDWRNRRIAHSDYDLITEKRVKPLEPATYEMVREAMKKIVDVINTISIYYQGSQTVFLVSSLFGGESLLYIIDEGLKASEERERRIESGNYTEQDIDHREL